MSKRASIPAAATSARGLSGLQVSAIVLVAVLVTAGATFWVLRTWVFPTEFEPVALDAREAQQLQGKLRAMGLDTPAVSAGEDARLPDGSLVPEPYFEDPSQRTISLSERELNALLANNTDLSRRLAIDLSDDLASARLLVPMDPGMPVLGGRTLRVTAGVELAYRDDRPVVALRGVSLMGVPIPNAWLGNLKNVDLVQEFGGGRGFWRGLSDGIEFVQIRDGALEVKLRE